ncbi:head-tail adaptor protein [Sphingomonas profundi]|uniref:head-tail adaptor protein n=1 Tax=Alterirhizorhabdus profundi TaxID=2681549 RepID=UPI0012E76FE0|nr:head-tail adaptor protein [Sphingomonas profundi]
MSGARELAGRLRERVTIAHAPDERDPLGAAETGWTITATRWAAIDADGGGDAVVAEAADAPARFRVTMRPGIAVAPGDRIGWAGRTLRVRALSEDPALPDRIVLRVEEIR